MTPSPANDVEWACAIMLGKGFCSADGWRGRLDASLVKRAFRARIFDVHPDRAQSLGLPVAELTARFQQVQRAYEILVDFLASPAPHRTAPSGAPARAATPQATPSSSASTARPRPAARPAPEATPRKAAHSRRAKATYYTGERPQRPLRFGEFLYYDGRITQEELFSAVRWQTTMRPRIGEIAMSFGYLDHARVHQLLEMRQQARKLHQPLAEFARDNGFLSHFQWMAVMGRQKRLQKPIGDFWVRQGRFSPEELAFLVEDQRRHNWYYTNKT